MPFRRLAAEKSLSADLAIGLMQAMVPLAERAARLPAGPSNPHCHGGMSFTALRDAAALPPAAAPDGFLLSGLRSWRRLRRPCDHAGTSGRWPRLTCWVSWLSGRRVGLIWRCGALCEPRRPQAPLRSSVERMRRRVGAASRPQCQQPRVGAAAAANGAARSSSRAPGASAGAASTTVNGVEIAPGDKARPAV